MPSEIVDGQDVFDIAEACLRAIDRARKGDGPTFVEAKTLRFNEHDIGTPDLSGWEQRSDEEHTAMREREPVGIATVRAIAEGWVTQAWLDKVRDDALAEVARVEQFADDSNIARPPVDELLSAVFAS
jgi:pyruvate dehydrogenase E1 component alpha subunit